MKKFLCALMMAVLALGITAAAEQLNNPHRHPPPKHKRLHRQLTAAKKSL